MGSHEFQDNVPGCSLSTPWSLADSRKAGDLPREHLTQMTHGATSPYTQLSVQPKNEV